MSIIDSKAFQKYVDKYDSDKFYAVAVIGRMASNLVGKYKGVILPSEAISWLFTGERPEILNEYKRCQLTYEFTTFEEDVLELVEDKEIKDCVIESIKKSDENQNLTYCYKGVKDTNYKARIRILTRIIWYQYNKYE